MHHALGTGIPYKYRHRYQYGAEFELPYIPKDAQDDCQRLIDWLLNAGSITVITGDILGGVYDNCYIWPDSEPSLSKPDPKDLRRVLSLSVLNADRERMICQYP